MQLGVWGGRNNQKWQCRALEMKDLQRNRIPKVWGSFKALLNIGEVKFNKGAKNDWELYAQI